MPDYVDRLVACGVNLADALDVYDDYMYSDDQEGLADYVDAVEAEYRARAKS